MALYRFSQPGTWKLKNRSRNRLHRRFEPPAFARKRELRLWAPVDEKCQHRQGRIRRQRPLAVAEVECKAIALVLSVESL